MRDFCLYIRLNACKKCIFLSSDKSQYIHTHLSIDTYLYWHIPHWGSTRSFTIGTQKPMNGPCLIEHVWKPGCILDVVFWGETSQVEFPNSHREVVWWIEFEPQPPRCAAKCPVCSQLSPIPRIGDLWRSHLVLESDLRGGGVSSGKYSIPCAKQESLMSDEIWI